MSNLSCGTHVAEPSANKDCRKLLNQFCRFLPKLKLPISADALFLAFPRRGNDKTPSDDTLGVLEGFISADSVVSEIGVPDPEGILVPVATEGFQVPVVVMLTADTMTFVSITA